MNRLRYGKADPNSPQYRERLKAEEELDAVRHAQREDPRRFDDSGGGSFGPF